MITVIGAGPAGLATAYHLRKRGLEYRVLEKEGVGSSWLRHYDRLRLNTIKELSALPGLAMPREYPVYPSASEFHSYLRTYAAHHGLRVECNVDVSAANYCAGGWRLVTNRGEVRSDVLVVATGTYGNPHRARLPGENTYAGRILHSCEYRNAEPFKDLRVLVVGAGSSGVDIALDLSGRGVKVGLVVRDGINLVPRVTSPTLIRAATLLMKYRAIRTALAPLLRKFRRDFTSVGLPPHPRSLKDLTYRPVVGYELADAVRRGDVEIHPAIKRFTKSGVAFLTGAEVAFDAVIFATGYRPVLGIIRDEVDLDAEGYPVLEGSRSLKNPNLYCVGFSKAVFRRSGWLRSIGGIAGEAADQIAAGAGPRPDAVRRGPDIIGGRAGRATGVTRRRPASSGP